MLDDDVPAAEARDVGAPGHLDRFHRAAAAHTVDKPYVGQAHIEGEALGMDAEVARRNSPVHNLASASGHLILTVGDDESEEFHRQQADFLAGWQGRGLACEVVGQPGRNHFSVVNELAKPESVLHKAVIRQILQ